MLGFAAKPKNNIKELLELGALVVDVRTEQEFKGGHAQNSINIPLDALSSHVDSLREKAGPKPVVLVCHSGGRSAIAANLLKHAGIDAVNGGAWRSL